VSILSPREDAGGNRLGRNEANVKDKPYLTLTLI